MGSRWGAARAGAAGASQGPGRDTLAGPRSPLPGGSCRGKGLRHPGTPHLGPRLPPPNPPASEPHRAGFKASSTLSKCGRAAELTGPVTRHREHREAWPPPPSAGTSTSTRAQDTTGAQPFPQQHHRSDPFSRIGKKSRFRGVAGLPGHKLCPLCGRVPLSWFPPTPLCPSPTAPSSGTPSLGQRPVTEASLDPGAPGGITLRHRARRGRREGPGRGWKRQLNPEAWPQSSEVSKGRHRERSTSPPHPSNTVRSHCLNMTAACVVSGGC